LTTCSDCRYSWVQRDAHPISLRQLTFFGRSLTPERLINAANYVRTELPTRIAHRIRDMQILPYVALTNQHLSHVYELYHAAFDKFRRIPEIRTTHDNDNLCRLIRGTLKEHLTVIPRLVMGVTEVQDLMKADQIDQFVTTMLRSVRTPGFASCPLTVPEAYIPQSHSRAAYCSYRLLQ
jgi:hypothetical protein